MDNEEKYSDISRKLKNLEPVKASDNFVHNLHSKIVEFEAAKRQEHEKRFDENRGGFLRNLFGNMKNPWLVPAAGFTVLIFFIFYVTFLNINTSEENAPLLSDQKQETIEQKNSPADQNKTSLAFTDSSLKEQENLHDKDIAGDLKTNENENSPSPVENTREYSESDEMKNSKLPLKTSEPAKNDVQLKSKSYETQNYTKQETDQKESEDTDRVTSEPQTGESSISAESRTYSDTSGAFKRKANEDDALKKKLDEKLRRINKSNLERIREEIIK